MRSRTDCAMVLPATSRMVKNTALTIAITIDADVADLLGEALGERTLRFGLGLIGRVGEFGVDLRGDPRGLVGIGNAHGVPADLPLVELPRLLEVIVAEKELAGVGALFRAVVDADDVEFPLRLAGRLRPRSASAAESGRRSSS